MFKFDLFTEEDKPGLGNVYIECTNKYVMYFHVTYKYTVTTSYTSLPIPCYLVGCKTSAPTHCA